jgi:hypothetical protein
MPARRPTLLAAVLAGVGLGAAAQELEPRAYSPNPTGVNFAGLAYAHTSGEVVFDASLPFSDVEAKLESTSLAYIRTFGLFGRAASAGVALPYVWGSVEGNVGEDFRRITRSGLADVRLRLAANVLGGPALEPRAFAARRPKTALGASLVVVAPTGQYDPAKLVNIGSNRWAVKPELGLSQPWRHLTLEAYAGVWLFGDNDDFFGGQHREQDPLGSFQAHVAYTFKPRLWLSADANYYTGGRTRLDGRTNADLQQNSRVGITLAVPAGRRHSFKVAWATGFTTRVGGNFDTLAVAWQTLWFD